MYYFCLSFLFFFNLEHILCLFMFHDMTFFKNTGERFCRSIAPFEFVWCFHLLRFRLCIFAWNTTAGYQWVMSGGSCCCCNTSNVNSYHLVMMVSSRSPYHKITYFSFIINKCLFGRYLETFDILFFINVFYPLVLTPDDLILFCVLLICTHKFFSMDLYSGKRWSRVIFCFPQLGIPVFQSALILFSWNSI